jgi:hypothetical protein
MTTGRINQVAIFLTHTTTSTSRILTSGDGQLHVVVSISSRQEASVTVVWFGSPSNIRRHGRNRDDRNYYGVPRPI